VCFNKITHPKKGFGKFQGGGGPQKPKCLKCEPKLEFSEGVGVQIKKP